MTSDIEYLQPQTKLDICEYYQTFKVKCLDQETPFRADIEYLTQEGRLKVFASFTERNPTESHS